ncbi:MAG: hypothetical protein JNJ55_09170 [Betaproteobacteria bacterium]|nr:hypothetical protein [Betaproteobacteria bacterium]
MAAASLANNKLTTHVRTLPSDDLVGVKQTIADQLRKKGAQVKIIDEKFVLGDLPSWRAEGPDIARKDYSSFRAKYDIDKLVVVNYYMVGMTRSYSAYFPTSTPRATVSGIGYMVNLADNKYDWYEPLAVSRAAEGEWDEPPNFPGLTNAYFQAIEMAKDNLTKPFK